MSRKNGEGKGLAQGPLILAPPCVAGSTGAVVTPLSSLITARGNCPLTSKRIKISLQHVAKN